MKDNKLFQKLKVLVSMFLPYCNLNEYIKTTGRKLALPIIDFLTLGLFKHLEGMLTKKSVYDSLSVGAYCSYKTMVVNLNRLAPIGLQIVGMFLKYNRQFAHIIKHTDATDLPVCLMKNVDHHKTMKDLATLSKSSKGWYYGLKLHVTRDFDKKVLKLKITTASASDRKMAKEMNKDLWGVIILDTGYVSTELQNEMNVEGKRWWIVKPYKTMKKLATILENLLYDTRMMVEGFFRELKLFRVLVSSLPRSVQGYLANYVYALFAQTVKPLTELDLNSLRLGTQSKSLVTV